MWLERKVQIIMQGTEIIELRAVARDITERKKAEAERSHFPEPRTNYLWL